MPNNQPLCAEHPVTDIMIGDMCLHYRIHRSSGCVEFFPYPAAMYGKLAEKPRQRPQHPIFDGRKEMLSWNNTEPDPLVQLAVRHMPSHGLWTAGETMRNHAATLALRFQSQDIQQQENTLHILTHLRTDCGIHACHKLVWHQNDPAFFVSTQIENCGDQAIEIDMLSSFSIAGLSPFATNDAPNRLRLHRFRTAWSNEGRHEALDLEDLHLERTWGNGPVFLRFGQSGSLPIRNFFPFIALEDKQSHTFWGAQIAWHGSWQMEFHRQDDSISLSGGLGDFERAHWMKQLTPGQSFTSPTAILSTCDGNIDDFCHRLVTAQQRLAHTEPQHETSLPIIFNEWCSTWGKPTHDYVLRTAEKLQHSPINYLVIDDGWAEKPPNVIQYNGDWNLNTTAFPHGLKATAQAVRQLGLIPGIWFEFENATRGTRAYELTDHQLKRHGKVIQVGNRHFWDFRDPFTFDYLRTKVINLLKDNDLGYLKVDYNESIGIGCDGAESLGEGLRQHLEKVKEFFSLIRSELPHLVIENCSSGGHRLEPGMVALTSMSSFSDAHETVEIPLIAANLHRLIPAHKNQIWAVLRPDDSPQRLIYSLCATFLGRMCLSGDMVDLSDDRFAIVKQAMELYSSAAPIIHSGKTSIQRDTGTSMRYPTGWQAVSRRSPCQNKILWIGHAFQSTAPTISTPLPDGSWQITSSFPHDAALTIDSRHLQWTPPADFSATVCLLEKSS